MLMDNNEIFEEFKRIEESEGIKLSKDQKLLLSEVGTLERTLSIITNSPIRVELIKQQHDPTNYSTVIREVWLKDITGRKLVYAKTIYNTKYLPLDVTNDLLLERMGIGSVIIKHNIETYRRIKKIGYDRAMRELFRVYQIMIDGDAVFEISEKFSRDFFL
jgi:chorismate-pyruvate lyase